MEPRIWSRCGEWSGTGLDPTQTELLLRYRDWLTTEAVTAGGIGPNEIDRVDNRHIGDSLLFAAGLHPRPDHVLDVGSGVGLPGIPLSIVLPETRFTLLDRSRRRVELMRRVVRILDLPNVEVEHGDIGDWSTPVDGIVSRASLSPEQALTTFRRILAPGGVAILGGSWARKPQVQGFELLEVPPSVLDQRVWLLMMRRQ